MERKEMKIVALCAVGAEKALSNELRKLGAPIIDVGFGKARFSADIEDVYRLLMGLRVADRLLLETADFHADNFGRLFDGAYSVQWEDIIPKKTGVSVSKVRSRSSKLQAETSIQAMVHKAIAKRLCEKWRMSRLPESAFQAEVRVYLEKDRVSLLLDLSGEPLFKRGYRMRGGVAPLRETTAASLLLLAGWRRKFPLYDPFCGAGTIVIEAALYAWDAAPGIGRDFAIEKLALHNPALKEKAREELRGKIDFNREIRIYGSDEDAASITAAESNIRRAYEIALGEKGEEAGEKPFLPNIRLLSMKDAAAPAEDRGFIITNPPYGKRLGEKSASEALYREMAGLGVRFSGWKLGIITDSAGFESFFGKKADSCREITNGALPSYFFQYLSL
jgi:putative N6-adenine-specific DNA methylase